MSTLCKTNIFSSIIPSVGTGKISLTTQGFDTRLNTRLNINYNTEAEASARIIKSSFTAAYGSAPASLLNSRNLMEMSRVGIFIATHKDAQDFLNGRDIINRINLGSPPTCNDYVRNPRIYNRVAQTRRQALVGAYLEIIAEAEPYDFSTDVLANQAYMISDIIGENNSLPDTVNETTFREEIAYFAALVPDSTLATKAGFQAAVLKSITKMHETLSLSWRAFVRDFYNRSSNYAKPIIDQFLEEKNARGLRGTIIHKVIKCYNPGASILVDLQPEGEPLLGTIDNNVVLKQGDTRLDAILESYFIDVAFNLPEHLMENGHLYMETYTYIDLDSNPDFIDRESASNLKTTFRMGSRDMIISDGRVGGISFVLYNQEGGIHRGAYHVMPASSQTGEPTYMTGEEHGPSSSVLTRINVPNTKIQDFRVAQRIFPSPYDMDKVNTFINSFDYRLSASIKNAINKYNLIKEKRINDKISNISTTHDVTNDNRIAFTISIDQSEILSKNSMFGSLYDSFPPEFKVQALWWNDHFNIVDVRIKRKRVREVRHGRSSKVEYVDFDTEEPIEYIADGREPSAGRVDLAANVVDESVRGSLINSFKRYNNEFEYADATGPASTRNRQSLLLDLNFLTDSRLTQAQYEQYIELINEQEYATYPENESKVLFPWVRELYLLDQTFNGNRSKTGLYQYGIEITYQDGILRMMQRYHTELVQRRAILQQFQSLVFNEENKNYDPYSNVIDPTLNASDEFVGELEALVLSYTVSYSLMFYFLGATSNENLVVMQDETETFFDQVKDIGLVLLDRKQLSRDLLDMFVRSYDLIVRYMTELLDMCSKSTRDASSGLFSSTSNNGKPSGGNFTVDAWFEPEIGKGIVDMRNQNLLRASLLPPSDEEGVQVYPVYDAGTMRERMSEEMFKFGVDAENFVENGFGESPASLTINSIVGSSVWNWSAESPLIMDGSLWSTLDLVTDVASQDRSKELDLQTKDKNQLLKTRMNLLEKANSSPVPGLSAVTSQASKPSVYSSKFISARDSSNLKKKSKNINTPEQKSVEISFEPGEECLAYSQETTRALIEHQRLAERTQRKSIQRELDRKLQEKLDSNIIKIGVEKPATSNETDERTAEPAAMIRQKAGASNESTQPDPFAPVATTVPKPFTVTSIKKEVEKQKKTKSKKLPLQLTAVSGDQSQYAKVESNKVSSTVFGNIVTLEKVTGYETDEKGKPNLKSEKTREVTVSEVMTGLSPGKYKLKEYKNEDAGIPATKQLPKVESFFMIRPSFNKMTNQQTNNEKEKAKSNAKAKQKAKQQSQKQQKKKQKATLIGGKNRSYFGIGSTSFSKGKGGYS